MWIVLNPKKAHRFTTKGINLHKGAPTAFVKPDTDPETMGAINRAIGDGRILRIQGNEMQGMVIPKQAKIGSVDTEDTDTVVRTQYVRDEQGNILSTVIVMPDEDGNVKNAEPKQGGVILTGISETDRDEDEDGGED
jgi:hypothetical protein